MMKVFNRRDLCALLLTCGMAYFLSIAAAEDTPQSLFARGNYLYEQGNYQEAIGRYEEIIRRGILSADVYYNAGNAYFKNGQLGKAIVNYERALLLAPRDKDTKKNLEIAQNKIVDKVKLPSTILLQRLLTDIHHAFTLDETLRFLSILVVILTVLIALAFYMIYARRALIPVIAFVAAIAVAVSISCGIKIYNRENAQEAVVIVPKVTVHSGPGEQYSVQFAVHEGTTFRAVKSLHGWLEMYISGDLRGWVKQEAVEMVWPVM